MSTFSEYNLQPNEVLEPYYEVIPYKSCDNATLTIDDENIAKIEGGKIKGVSVGSTTLNITAKNFTKKVPINVGKQISDVDKKKVTSTRNASDICIINPISKMNIGDNHMLWAVVFSNDTNFLYDMTSQDNVVNITSNNPAVVSTQFGVLFANKVGTATITVSDVSGNKTKSFNVVVENNSFVPTKTLNVDITQFNLNKAGTSDTGVSNAQGFVNLFKYASENKYNHIVFPQGIYNLNGDFGTITVPSNMIIDFNNSIIQLELRKKVDITKWEHVRANNEYAFTMFSLLNTKNCIIKNGKFYGENYLDKTEHHIEHELMFNIIGSCDGSKFVNCEFSYAPGFNVNLSHNVYTDTRTAFKLSNAEIGGYTNIGANDDNITTRFRCKDYISLSSLNKYKDKTLTFGLGCIQGYGGYAYVKSRFYNIYFFDENKQFISKLDKCVQFEYYQRPANSSYCKIEFYQDYLPTSADPDFGGIIHLFAVDELKGFRFENCKFEKAMSTGLCPQGGTDIIIDNCEFLNCGYYDPASQIDWEDGGQHIHGHIVKNCLFKSTDKNKHNIINVKSRSVALYNNVFDYCTYEQRTEVENARIFKNKIINGSTFTLDSKTDMVYAYNIHENEPIIRTIVDGMSVWQFDNFKITQGI